MPEAFIVGAVRTAGGRKNGKLKDWHPIDLGAFVLDELGGAYGRRPGADRGRDLRLRRPGGSAVGQHRAQRRARLAPARERPGTTVDRQCGSSQQALHFARRR
jgi:acetyl-CoA C-acetyltransferase